MGTGTRMRGATLVLAAAALAASVNTSPHVDNAKYDSTNTSCRWQQLTSSPGWYNRSDHIVAQLPSGRLLLAGGESMAYTFYRTLGDVWSSDDGGSNWDLLLQSTPWGPRGYHAAVTMVTGEVLLTGGGGRCPNWTTSAAEEVPYTPGMTMTQYVQKTGLQALPWKMLARGLGNELGLHFDNCTYFGDSWTTTDGVMWSEITRSGPWWAPRGGHTLTVMPSGALLLAGGWDNGTVYSDVWLSTDNGRGWSQLSTAAWPARAFHTATLVGDLLIIMGGGNAATGAMFSDAWATRDGAVWWELTANAPWGAREDHAAALVGSTLFLTGGNVVSVFLCLNDVWGCPATSQCNATDWVRYEASAAFAPRSFHVMTPQNASNPTGASILTGGWFFEYPYPGPIPFINRYFTDVWRMSCST